MADNNSTTGVAWWVKATSGTVAFFEGLQGDKEVDLVNAGEGTIEDD